MEYKNNLKTQADDLNKDGLVSYLKDRIDNISQSDMLSFEQKVQRSEELRILLRRL